MDLLFEQLAEAAMGQSHPTLHHHVNMDASTQKSRHSLGTNARRLIDLPLQQAQLLARRQETHTSGSLLPRRKKNNHINNKTMINTATQLIAVAKYDRFRRLCISQTTDHESVVTELHCPKGLHCSSEMSLKLDMNFKHHCPAAQSRVPCALSCLHLQG